MRRPFWFQDAYSVQCVGVQPIRRVPGTYAQYFPRLVCAGNTLRVDQIPGPSVYIAVYLLIPNYKVSIKKIYPFLVFGSCATQQFTGDIGKLSLVCSFRKIIFIKISDI